METCLKYRQAIAWEALYSQPMGILAFQCVCDGSWFAVNFWYISAPYNHKLAFISILLLSV